MKCELDGGDCLSPVLKLPDPNKRKAGSGTQEYHFWAHSSSLCKTFHCFHKERTCSNVGLPANCRKLCNYRRVRLVTHGTLIVCQKRSLMYGIHLNAWLFVKISISCFPWDTLYLEAHFFFPTSWLSSALFPSSFWLLQRAGIHNPLGPSDWKCRRKDRVPKSYKECNRKYIYYSDLHSNAAALSTQKLSRNELLFKDFTGDVEQVGGRRKKKKESCIKPYVKFINFRGDKNQRDWSGRGLASFLFDQRRHDTLLTSSPCYGRREKSALLRFKGFHLYRVGVTTSNILEILAQKACAILPSTGRLPDVRAPSD